MAKHLNHSEKSRTKSQARGTLAVATVAITLFCVVATIIISRNVSLAKGIPDIPFNDLSAKSFEMRLSLSENLFQLALLMLGALWGLVIAKKDEAQIVFSKAPEVILFVGASLLLIFSAVAYSLYVNKLTGYFSDAAISAGGGDLSLPNIFDQNVNYLFVIQILNLVAGVMNGIFTLFSAHKLKED